MATNAHTPVRSARRCILRPPVSKLAFTTAVAIATSSALAFFGVVKASPQLARASQPAGAQVVSGGSYGYPIKPFDAEHPIRGYFGDPRTQFLGPPTLGTVLHGSGKFSFHQGVDISAPNGTAVYPVADGTVSIVNLTQEWVRVDSGGGRAFEYWHIRPLVGVGQQVAGRQTVLGHVMRPAGHVHLTERENGQVVNPLVPGRLTPYHDSTQPSVRLIAFRRNDTGRELLPSFIRGRVEMVVDAEDLPTMPVPGLWRNLPVTPALITWRIQRPNGRIVVPRHIAVDRRTTVPPNTAFWSTYARGTYQNMSVFGPHYSYLQRGSYLFKLTPQPFDTHSLRDGVYDLVVTATDIRGNTGSSSLRFSVHNRRGWR
jgi:murein DD-endopeptidase MepM/ murein hydrolase activator NlpD